MKVISLLQPWASLVVLGLKKIETRSFNTKIRGRVLVHASAGKPTKEILRIMERWTERFGLPVYQEEDFPRGAIIGSVEITETKKSESILAGGDLSDEEHAFGDYTCSRWGWFLNDPIVFDNPIPAKGDLGFWNTLNKKAFSISELNGFFVVMYYGQIMAHVDTKDGAERSVADLLSGDVGEDMIRVREEQLFRKDNSIFHTNKPAIL